jgi:hypothetical protein
MREHRSVWTQLRARLEGVVALEEEEGEGEGEDEGEAQQVLMGVL